jgi:hypothetical protein
MLNGDKQQSADIGIPKLPMLVMLFLCIILKLKKWLAVTTSKITLPMLFKETPSSYHYGQLTHWHTQLAVRRAEPSMPLLLILALCQ